MKFSHFQQRVESLGRNATTPRQFVRSQQPRQRAPIQRPTPLRTISERGASSSQEIQELRQELHEMKQILRMTMEVQLDTQRAVRQEVAAVFEAFMSDYLAKQSGKVLKKKLFPTFFTVLVKIQQRITGKRVSPKRRTLRPCVVDTPFFLQRH